MGTNEGQTNESRAADEIKLSATGKRNGLYTSFGVRSFACEVKKAKEKVMIIDSQAFKTTVVKLEPERRTAKMRGRMWTSKESVEEDGQDDEHQKKQKK